MEEFPIFYTNFWDALIAVPAIIVLIEILKIFAPFIHARIPSIAIILGLLISIFIAHPYDLWAGVFMGIFYGYAAVGAYSSFVYTIHNYRNKDSHDRYR